MVVRTSLSFVLSSLLQPGTFSIRPSTSFAHMSSSSSSSEDEDIAFAAQSSEVEGDEGAEIEDDLFDAVDAASNASDENEEVHTLRYYYNYCAHANAQHHLGGRVG